MAFAQSIMDARPALVRFAVKLCHDAERAEDFASEAITRAWAARERFQPGTNLRGWLAISLRNLFLSDMRRKRWDGGYVDDLAGLVIPTPADQEGVVTLRDVERALALLPDEQARAILAVALEGTYEEAAGAELVSVGTMKSRVARGRAALAELLA